jgi:SLOG family YspA-like protein
VKVIIAGSRTIPEHIGDELVEMATRIARLRGWDITEVVWGKARGIDACGKRWADKNGIPVKPFPADWDKNPNIAGFIRNGEMAEYGEALIAITNGSQGTRDMIRKARDRKMPMIVIAISGATKWIKRTDTSS